MRSFAKQQLKELVSYFKSQILFKKLTDKQLIMIFNAVLIPKLIYLIQIIPLSSADCHTTMRGLLALIKHRIGLSKYLASVFLFHKDFYRVQELHYQHLIQLNNAIINNLNSVTDFPLLERTSKIRLFQLQSILHLNQSPLIQWSITKPNQLIYNNFVRTVLSFLFKANRSISIACPASLTNSITDGSIPITNIIGPNEMSKLA